MVYGPVYQSKKIKIDISSLKRLGIDEIALRKGQGNYIVVLVDLDRRLPIDFVVSRKQEDIKEVLEGWGKEVLSHIIEVSIDLCTSYRSLVQELLPNANIVADRFHVMKIVNKDLDSVRKELRRSNKENENELERDRIEEVLKKSKYALLKPEENLTEKQKDKLDEIREVLPSLAEIHQQKEAFRKIFEESQDWHEGAFKLIDWMIESQDNFKDSISTIRRWFGEITEYFGNRTTNGAVEGINNKLKLIKRSGYGFGNFENFKLRCLICWHLDISKA